MPKDSPAAKDAGPSEIGLATIGPGKTPETFVIPECRIKDVASLNAVIDRIIQDDEPAAIHRTNVQEMIDGKAPFNQAYIDATGQEGRCNLNFGDGKKRIKLVSAGYYDLTESVPYLALLETDFGKAEENTNRTEWNYILSEEFHRMLKEWKEFDSYFQLLVQKFVSHGVGFLYFSDDLDWRWKVAGLEDFKLPRAVGLSEDECDIAIVLRDVPIGKVYSWIRNVPDNDTRWNKVEVQNAIMKATDPNVMLGPESWERWQQTMKNNDLFASITAKDTVKVVYAWVREFSGKMTQFTTLRNKQNNDFLFKCYEKFECVNECFNFFPYEVGTNGTLHSVRGEGHDIYARVQTLTLLRCQTVDNARINGSLLLQPSQETAAEDMAILFYGGAAYLPPNIDVKNAQLNNPSTNLLPVLQDMSMGINGDINTRDARASQQEKTKFEVRNDIAQESILPTAAMALFYQPWGRHLLQVCKRSVFRKGVKKSDPGGQLVLDMRKRCIDRGVPKEVFDAPYTIRPYRALGLGSPSNRLASLNELMQFYGSLDPVGQNNLLRDQFAQRVTYGQVERYVQRLEVGGRLPVDVEVAELQNIAMGQGAPLTVAGNDAHIIHLNVHFPSIDQDLTMMESGQGSPGILQGIRVKADHIKQHMATLKPDKLNEKVVKELARLFNNTIERVQAAMEHAQLEAQQQAQEQSNQPSPKETMMLQEHQTKMQIKVEDAALDRQLRQQAAQLEQSIKDAEAAAALTAKANAERIMSAAAIPQ